MVGRGAASLQDHVEIHDTFLAESRDVNAEITKLANTVARPVDPVRAKIPTVAAKVRLEDHFPLERARVFCSQDKLVVRPEPPGRPRRCHMISHTSEAALRLRLLDSGAAMLWAVEDVPCATGRLHIWSVA